VVSGWWLVVGGWWLVVKKSALVKNNQIENIDSEINNCQNKLKRLRKKVPWGILGRIVFSFLFPFIPGRRGRRPMIESWDYHNAVMFCALVYVIVYPIGYTMGKNKLEKRLRE